MKINKITEEKNINSIDIDKKNIDEILSIINKEDTIVSQAVKKSIPKISLFIEDVIKKINQSGRLVYIGSGTSGRLGVLDASECPPTFGVSKDLVQGVIAGGDKALKESVEGAEDSIVDSVSDLKKLNLNSKDIILGISASGTTPFVLTALDYANKKGAVTGFLTCNKIQPIRYVNHLIEIIVGPEIISGSTRLKAGTATKMVLNMISTASMIKLNHTFGNTMIDLVPKNKKLIQRALSIIVNELSINKNSAEELYELSQHNLKIAIIIGKKNLSYNQAYRLLNDNNNSLEEALN